MMLSPLTIKYIVSELKYNPWQFIKVIILLIPSLAIIGMFSTLQGIPYINQKIFLNNAGNQRKVLSE